MPVNLSKIYGTFHKNLREAHEAYKSRLKRIGGELLREWESCLKNNIIIFPHLMKSAGTRREIYENMELFFRTSELQVPFAAIDGSCHKELGDRFLLIYGGAFCARGFLELEPKGERKLVYRRTPEQDVSYVAFIPVPPEDMEQGVTEDQITPPRTSLSDSEMLELGVIHTRIMQLAEVYAALDLADSHLDPPKLILMDNSLSSWLANTSFVNRYMSIINTKVAGKVITKADLYYTLAHPFNEKLGVPPAIDWLPHNRIIAEAYWKNSDTLEYSELLESMGNRSIVDKGITVLADKIRIATREGSKIILKKDPRSSWEEMEELFKRFCRKLFKERDWRGLICEDLKYGGSRRYLTSRELQFISGIGLRLLIERCWEKHILLIGVVKDSSSRYFYRNYLGSMHIDRGESSPGVHANTQLSDRTILEFLSQLIDEIEAPWSTIEFDSAFMTILPQPDNSSWKVRGYLMRREGKLIEYTMRPRLFLRSIAQFMLNSQTRLASHALFVDRLAYPGWDDRDSNDFNPSEYGSELGPIRLLRYSSDKPPRLQLISMLLLNMLVRNLYPEAPGYPEPLHRADLGAKAFRDRVKKILTSAWRMEKSNPLVKTFRILRQSIIRRS